VVAEEAMEEVVEAATKEAAKVAVPEIHAIAAKEAVTKEAATAALREICHEKFMTMLEAVAMGGRVTTSNLIQTRSARYVFHRNPRTIVAIYIT
jgi:hypothetical protein